jgi:hypothetical protein
VAHDSASIDSEARHSELRSTCTSSRTSATGEVLDNRADPSRGTTRPAIELPGEVSASKTRRSIGSTASSAAAMRPSKAFGSLSASSAGTQAKAWPSCSAHCDSNVVFPKPDGATTETMGGESACVSRSISDRRRTLP